MKYYPVFLDLADKAVLLVGGGEIGLQKARGFLDCGARLLLVAPEVLPEVETLAREGKLRWERRGYATTDLDGVKLVIAATDDPALQKRIAAEARERGLWVNIVDVPPLCDFIAPALVQRGEVQVAVSTGGAAPALAKFIRQKLEGVLGPEVGQLVEIVRPLRADILKLSKDRRRSLWECIVSQPFLDQIKKEGPERAAQQLKKWIYGTLAV